MDSDPFNSTSDSLIAPARLAFSVVPHDHLNLAMPTRALYIGTGGDVAVRPLGSANDVVLRNVSSGSVLALRVSAVRLSGTTASDLVGLA